MFLGRHENERICWILKFKSVGLCVFIAFGLHYLCKDLKLADL